MHVFVSSVSEIKGQFHENGLQNTKKINFCNKYVTGITGKLIICSLLCKKIYMIISIHINCVDI